MSKARMQTSYQYFESLFSHTPVLLAPMAGITDKVFRGLCVRWGADMAYSEMVSSKALSFKNAKTDELLALGPSEDKIAVQLFGHEPYVMAEQAAIVVKKLGSKLAYLDVNMGCPARKIVSKGDGSALMKEPELAAQIVREIKKQAPVPLTVKFRRGYQLDNETAVDFALRMQEAGVNAVAVHGRYAMQYYKGSSDWGVIKRVKQALDIPVIGNGDITSGPIARSFLEETGCDALMIGRGAYGAPWIFSQIKAHLRGCEFIAPSPLEVLDYAEEHARLLHEDNPRAMVRMRKHAMFYMAGMPAACELRARCTSCETLEDFKQVFDLAREHYRESLARKEYFENLERGV